MLPYAMIDEERIFCSRTQAKAFGKLSTTLYFTVQIISACILIKSTLEPFLTFEIHLPPPQ